MKIQIKSATRERACLILAAMTASLVLASAALAAPSNDNFANADGSRISGVSGSFTAAASGATTEPDEPALSNGGPHGTLWYKWTAPANGLMTLKCDDEYLFMDIGVYTGDALGSLSRKGLDDTGCARSLTFRAISGQTYKIQLDRYFANSGGSFRLTYNFVQAPANDDFDDAITLTGVQAGHDSTSHASGEEPGEPPYSTRTVWYKWTAPESGEASVDTCAYRGKTLFDTKLAVYTGGSLDSLAPAKQSDGVSDAQNNDACYGIYRSNDDRRASRVLFDATAGETYMIQVGGNSGSSGGFELHVKQPPDHESPVVESVLPAENGIVNLREEFVDDVDGGGTAMYPVGGISTTFDEPLDPTTIVEDPSTSENPIEHFTVTDEDTGEPLFGSGASYYSDEFEGSYLIYNALDGFIPGHTYSVTLEAGPTDVAGNPLAEKTWAFTANAKPKISGPFTPGNATRSRKPTISARVSDGESAIARSGATLMLDGKKVSNFTLASGRISYTPRALLSYGRHTVRLTVKDPQNLSASAAWAFTVQRPQRGR